MRLLFQKDGANPSLPAAGARKRALRSFIKNLQMRPGRACACIAFILILSGCTGTDLHIKSEGGISKPSRILIDNFEVRDISYDPYISREFSEAVAFEFFRMGYDVRIVEREQGNGARNYRDSERAAYLCGNYKADIFITGVISRRETGYLSDRKSSAGITFLIYSANGDLIGKGYYSRRDSPDISKTAREAAPDFAKKLNARLRRE